MRLTYELCSINFEFAPNKAAQIVSDLIVSQHFYLSVINKEKGMLTTFPQCNFHWNFQKYSVKILYAIID